MTGPGRNHPHGVDASGRAEPSGKPVAPRQVSLAWWFWIASTVVGVVRAVVQLSDRRMLIEQMRRTAPDLSQSEVDAAASSATLLTLLLALTIAAVYVLLANRMVQGRNWARIVMVALAALSAVGAVLMLFGMATLGSTVSMQGMSVSVDALNVVFSLIVAALDAAVLALVLHPDANRFFREATRYFHDRRRKHTSGSG